MVFCGSESSWLWAPLTFSLVSYAQASNPATQQLKSWLAAFDGTNWETYLANIDPPAAEQVANFVITQLPAPGPVNDAR